ncbi:MAG TPA: C39 family peptidase, partial [Chryseolinea sp.]|nr:C39 family peptidase [Chryseolinea sp.]
MSTDQISGIQLTSTTIDVDTWNLSYRWTCTDKSIDIENNDGFRAFFNIPSGSPEKQVMVTLAVDDGFSKSVITQAVDVPAYSVQRARGLGSEVQEEVTDKTSYPWYIDQSNSGVFAAVNCGPASVTMALKWFNKSFSSSAQDARSVYHWEGGWWFTNDIINYLNNNGATNYTIALDVIDRLKEEIDAGNIVILCLDMYYVTKEQRPEHHTNKFYAAEYIGWGHFIVIKGYKKVDGIVYYEAYDPYSFG